MKIINQISSLLILCILLFTSCNTDNDTSPTLENKTVNFSGTVVDNINSPIEDATISLGELTTTTDENGRFTFNTIELVTDFAYIKSVKDSYISGFRMLNNLEKNNTVRIAMFNDHLSTIMGTGGDSAAQFPTGFTLRIDGNISNEDGSVFSGLMYPVIHHIAPNTPNSEEFTPGIRTIDEYDYGFVFVKLEDAEKNLLDITDGHTAVLEFDIIEEALPTAPEIVNVLNFNIETGLWENYGEATKIKILDVWVYKTNVASFANSWFKIEGMN